MNSKWDDGLFKRFIQLRDAFRAAKREKNYQLVLSIGQNILVLDKSASFLQIATPIFQKDMAEACTKLGDTTAAINYLLAARIGFEGLKNDKNDWQRDLDAIDKKLKKLRVCA
ncbi:MAG: hypothetical protein ACREPL_13250 [Rhodanobacteraceae bacterium]